MVEDLEEQQARMRQRGRRRLIGASVIAVALVAVLPPILEREGQTVGHDIPVHVPAPGAAAHPGASSSASTPAAGADRADSNPTGAFATVQPPPASGNQPAPPTATPVVRDAAAPARSPAEPQTPAGKGADAKAAARPAEVASPEVKQMEAEAAGSRSAAARAARAERDDDAADGPGRSPSRATAEASEKSGSASRDADEGASKPARGASREDEGAHAHGAGRGAFAVQVGVFSDPAKARQLEDRLATHAFKVYSEVVHGDSSSARTRVRVGPFPTREAAERAQAQLVLLNESALIVRP